MAFGIFRLFELDPGYIVIPGLGRFRTWLFLDVCKSGAYLPGYVL